MNSTPHTEQLETMRMPTEQLETMRMPSRVLTVIDSSGRVNFDYLQSWLLDEPIQSQDALFQMPLLQQPETSVSTEAELADILSWLEDEPAAVQSQSQDALFQMSPTQQPELMRMSSRILTEAHIGSIGFDETTRIQGQDAIFQTPPPQPQLSPPTRVWTREEIYSFVTSSGIIDIDAISLSRRYYPARYQPRDDSNPLNRMAFPTRVMNQEEIYSFTTSSDAILLTQQNYPAIYQPRDDINPPRQPETMIRVAFPSRVLTLEEIYSFTTSSGLFDYDAILLRQQNYPARYQPRDDRNPPRQPETMSREAYILRYQSKGLSKRTISKNLKTMSADEIRAEDKDGDGKICAVCLDDMRGRKDKIAILDECGHEFHYCCLEKWLRRKNICPLCRRTAIYLLQDR